MALITQQLRTTTATKIPDGLEPGQIAFNLANGWMMVGVGGTDILVNGAAVASYGGPLTIFDVASVAVPAKPAADKGYEIYRLEDQPPPNNTLHGMSDVDDAAVAAVTAANAEGVLVRDGSVAADGDPGAYKLVSVVDLGSF